MGVVSMQLDKNAASVLTGSLKRLFDRYVQKLEEASNNGITKFIPGYIEGINEVYMQAVDAFYRDYLPTRYERIYSLYDPMIIEQSGHDITITVDVDRVLPHSSWGGGGYSASGVFAQAYDEGWHGGPLGDGGQPAHISNPIWEDFENRFNTYKETVAVPALVGCIQDEIRKIKL